MTGPEHFAEGERLLATCEKVDDPQRKAAVAAQAQAHFQAAQVAVLVHAYQPNHLRWQEAIGT